MQSISLETIAPTDQLIHQWLKERQELIVILEQLCRYRPFNQPRQQGNVTETLQEFCQLLVDYVSLGHFEIFEHILHLMESSEQSHYRRAQQLLPLLLQNTFAAVEFNDHYQSDKALDSLEKDLSLLVEQIAERFEWEDQMLQACSLYACLSGEAS